LYPGAAPGPSCTAPSAGPGSGRSSTGPSAVPSAPKCGTVPCLAPCRVHSEWRSQLRPQCISSSGLARLAWRFLSCAQCQCRPSVSPSGPELFPERCVPALRLVYPACSSSSSPSGSPAALSSSRVSHRRWRREVTGVRHLARPSDGAVSSERLPSPSPVECWTWRSPVGPSGHSAPFPMFLSVIRWLASSNPSSSQCSSDGPVVRRVPL
jgi:hypothetical protein